MPSPIFKLRSACEGLKFPKLRRIKRQEADRKIGRRMSALGQKQTSRHLQPMSALPPKADIAERDRHVCFVPKADIKLVVKRGYSGAELTATDRPAHLSWKE
jgi:hypothetical protein